MLEKALHVSICSFFTLADLEQLPEDCLSVRTYPHLQLAKLAV